MAPQLAPEEPFVQQKGTAMRKDACYIQYVEALQCLDKHDYQQHFCEDMFRAFKACRSRQEEANNVSRLKTFESDPLLGWAFKLYNNWTAEQAATHSSSSSSDNATQEYQGWRPPPEDVRAQQEQLSSSSSSSDGSGSSGDSSVTSSPLEKDPLWGWAFRWYNSSKASSSGSGSSST